MTSIEKPQAVSLVIDDAVIPGEISGTVDAVKFKSNNIEFLKHFPAGEFDSLNINERKMTFHQSEILSAAKQKIASMLGMNF